MCSLQILDRYESNHQHFENFWKEAAIADNGRSQSVDGPGADGPGRYKKNGELRQPRTQEEKVSYLTMHAGLVWKPLYLNLGSQIGWT